MRCACVWFACCSLPLVLMQTPNPHAARARERFCSTFPRAFDHVWPVKCTRKFWKICRFSLVPVWGLRIFACAYAPKSKHTCPHTHTYARTHACVHTRARVHIRTHARTRILGADENLVLEMALNMDSEFYAISEGVFESDPATWLSAKFCKLWRRTCYVDGFESLSLSHPVA